MSYSHCRTRVPTLILTLTRIPNTVVTLYYAEVFTLVSEMVTVAILGTALHPMTDVHPNFTVFQSGDQSPNLNQWEISA